MPGDHSSSPDGVSAAFGPNLSERAQRVRALSVARWGEHRAVEMVGCAGNYLDLLSRIEKVAPYSEPVLISGESGVGKELMARAIYLLSQPRSSPFVPVNCPQFQEDNLTVSELFGHTKGSFTGAVADRRGAFDEADGGVIFLDEIADLNPGTQALLLRTLSTGELKPLGATQPHTVSVRVVSATNVPLNHLVITKHFRYDLFFRLRHFHLHVPALRERGDDWARILDFCLRRLCERYGVRKTFSRSAIRALEGYRWPGNVRQLITLVTTGYAMADGAVIEADDIAEQLEDGALEERSPDDLLLQVIDGAKDFWQIIYQPFMERDLNRSQVKAVIKRGLVVAEGHYSRLVDLMHMPAADYQRFMDFLRHHRLKP
jgi:DNA-binding NtrC family response regulator